MLTNSWSKHRAALLLTFGISTTTLLVSFLAALYLSYLSTWLDDRQIRRIAVCRNKYNFTGPDVNKGIEIIKLPISTRHKN